MFSYIPTLVFGVLLCIFQLLFSTPIGTALKFQNNISQNSMLEDIVSHLFSLYNSCSSLCILSFDDDLFDVLIQQIRAQDIKVSDNVDNASLFRCEKLLLLNLRNCSGVTKFQFDKYTSSVYHLIDDLPTNLADFDNCFNSSRLPEVVIFSLREFSMFELSPVFSLPRYFIKSSLNQVLTRRMKRVQEDLHGIQLTGAFMLYPPFTIVPDEFGKTDKFDGIEVLLFRQLSQKLNFTMRYLLFDNWGSVGNNGVWQCGVGQAMQQADAQVAVANIWEFPSLYKIMDFGPSISRVKLGFIVRRPKQIDFDWRNLIAIFQLNIWLFTLLCFVTTAILYWLGINRGLSYYQKDWSCSVMAVFGHFTFSTFHNYRTDGDHFSRFVLTFWSIFAILFTSLLSSGIYSSLTLPLYSPRVDTLRQLVEGGYYWTAQYYARLENLDLRQSLFNFQNRWHSLLEKKYKFMYKSEVETQTYFDEKITFLVQTYGHDLIILDTQGLHGHAALKEFRMVKEVISETHISFGVEKNSPLLKPLSKMTIRFLEVGLLQQWKSAVTRRWKVHDTRHLLLENDDPTFSEPVSLQLKKLQPIFYLLLLGLSCSFFIFLLELYWYFS